MEIDVEEEGSHYGVLGVKYDADVEDIKKAHRRLALKWHPDKVANASDAVAVKVATQQFQRLQEAYEVLSDATKRYRYDLELQRHHPSFDFAAANVAKRARTEYPGSTADPHAWKPSEKTVIKVPQEVETIAAAIDKLPSAGGKILVAPGVHKEGLIVIAKPYVEIVAAGAPGSAILRGQLVYRECATGARLAGISVRAACTAGAVDLKGMRGIITIEDCEISNERSAGLIFEGTAGKTTLRRSRVHSCRYDGLGMHVANGRSTLGLYMPRGARSDGTSATVSSFVAQRFPRKVAPSSKMEVTRYTLKKRRPKQTKRMVDLYPLARAAERRSRRRRSRSAGHAGGKTTRHVSASQKGKELVSLVMNWHFPMAGRRTQAQTAMPTTTMQHRARRSGRDPSPRRLLAGQ
eukprot:TRINITY_DN18219_c0_g1_i4.p1 TRINITY_DN18219_c0_g1~~TRINITY_DN18219_c0_g1_i4.p1  ORF type:complete len:407 (+),score=66.36 TRINITY_DN18219_c0_g1_i4:57-1277(+)